MTMTLNRSTLVRTLRAPALAAAVTVLVIMTAAAPAGAAHRSTCVTPSWKLRLDIGARRRAPVKTPYQLGLAAGQHAGRQAGYAAGLYRRHLNPSPARWLPRRCSPRFAHGFRVGFRHAYRLAYHRGVIARRQCRSW